MKPLRILPFAVFFFTLLPSSPASAEVLYLTLTSDLHGRIGTTPDGGAPRLGSFLRQIRRRAFREKARFLNLHAGDIFQGTPVVNGSRGDCMGPILGALRYHIGIPGNHEWDYGPAAFQKLAHLPRPLMLSSSIQGLGPRIPPRLLYQLGKDRIGFLGYTTTDTRRGAPPSSLKGLTFLSGDGVAREAKKLRERGASILVLLAHAWPKVAATVGQKAGVDLILGAHSNDVTPLHRWDGDGPWFQQAGFHLQHASWLRLEIQEGKLRDISGKVKALRSFPPDPTIAALARPWLAPYQEALQRPITTLQRTLYKGPWGGHSTLVAVAAQGLRDLSGADFGLLNVKASRLDTLGPGEINGKLLYEAFPYENQVAVVKLTGKELDQLYEANVKTPFRGPRKDSHWTQGLFSSDPRGVLQPAGFTVVLNPEASPGERIQLLAASGEPLKSDQTYTVATSDFLAMGGDGHPILATTGFHKLPSTLLEAIQIRLKKFADQAPCGPGGLRNLTHPAADLSCPPGE
jgi:5'-nucleotidase